MSKLPIHRILSILLVAIFLLVAHSTAQSYGPDQNSQDGGEGPWNPWVTPQPGYLLPDLQTLPPFDLRLVYDPGSERLFIRFSNSIWNAGEGDLELKGKPDLSRERITVSQSFYDINGNIRERQVGEFIFHPQHLHWHLEGFSLYEIWSLTREGRLDARLASSGKVSYCVMDASLNLPGPAEPASATPRFYTCGASQQGISAGWMDTYKESVAGQWLDITPLKSGNYALISTVDPDDILMEADDRNNRAITYFQLAGHRILRYGDLLRDIGIFPDRLIPTE
jgi:hypothetical protein